VGDVGRVTISDVARAAGVSKGVVSFALNGRPGVSEQNRERILAIAQSMGWRPSSAARALSNARANAVGFVLARPPQLLSFEPYFREIIVGVEEVMAARGVALVLQMVNDIDTELEVYDRWWGERRVDGVLLSDLRLKDPRPTRLQEIGLPAAAFGLSKAVPGLAAVRFDEAIVMIEIVDHLAGLGHVRLARVAGRREFRHTSVRSRAIHSEIERRGLVDVGIRYADYTAAEASAATKSLISGPEARPTAILYDNDVMAMAGVRTLREAGLRVPDDVSIVAMGNSIYYDLIDPPITATERDVVEFGAAGAKALLDLLDGHEPQTVVTSPGQLVIRSSTGPART
jgi:DNA-binding LacI/PurR family transcriptional regulator